MKDLYRMLRYSQKHIGIMQKFCNLLKKHFQIENFWYYKTNPDGRQICFEAYIEYQDYFFESESHVKDPFIINSLNIAPGPHLYFLIEDTYFQSAVDAFEHKFHSRPILALVEQQKEAIHCIGISFKTNAYKKASQVVLNNVPLLKDFAQFFIQEAQSQMRDMNDYCCELFESPTQICRIGEKSKPMCSSETKSNFLEDLYGLKKGTLTSLTSRENEVMKYVQMGLTATHIGLKMNISYRTAEHHIENIKLKLNCESKNDLFKYAQLMDKCNLFNDLQASGSG